MPMDAIDISTTVEAAPPVRDTYGLPLVAGEETTNGYGDAPVDTIVKIETYSEAETQFGADTELTYEIKGALDEAGAPVYGYKFDIDYGGSETYPGDATMSELEAQLEKYPEIGSMVYSGIDMIVDESSIDKLVGPAEKKDLMLILEAETGDPADITALSGIAETKNLFAVAHNYSSTDGVSGRFMGAVVRVEPYEKVMWKEITSLSAQRFYTSSEVDTIETEMVNAVMPKSDRAIFSQGQTYTSEELYRWVDGVRSKFYIKSDLENGLTRMISSTNLPFNGRGIDKVKNTISKILSDLIDEGYIDNYTVNMPDFSEITASERDDRVLNGVEIDVRIAGHIQAINIDLTLRF